jgi:capsular polysaccharide export protein
MIMTRDPIDCLASAALIAVTSRTLAEWPHVEALFGGRRVAYAGTARAAQGASALAGWGMGGTGALASRLALSTGLPRLLLEDGFIRSVGLGKSGAPTVSVVVDDLGIYYDASAPSRLEALLANPGWESDELIAAGSRLRDLLVIERLTKFNHLPDRMPRLRRAARLLLVDQVHGDRSIALAGASAATFQQMLAAALGERDASSLLVRVHPDVSAGRAKGHLVDAAKRAGITILEGSINPHAVLDEVDEVWTVSSQLGLDALLRGKKVATFGMPFYAGWGLAASRAADNFTAAALVRRSRERSVAELVAATFLLYCRYADPVTRQPLDAFAAADRLVDWRRKDRTDTGASIAVGFSRWKRKCTSGLLGGTAAPVEFSSTRKVQAQVKGRAKKQGVAPQVFVWGMTGGDAFEAACRAAGRSFLRVEDGFLRGVGLGSDLTPPGSLVVDPVGIHYDARRPSGIDTLLAGGIDDALRRRAQSLRELIVGAGLTKYNLPGSSPVNLRAAAKGRQVLLVAGQVPGDASLRFTGPAAGNLDLVRAVRAAAPTAFIAYKRHPDLVAGNRRVGKGELSVDRHVDLVLTEGSVVDLAAAADEVHVISSLAGFEALLRGRKVVCWGWPFYAGRGLTDDRFPMPYTRAACSLDELVAAALILYPRYVDPVSRIPCEVEEFIAALAMLPSRRCPRVHSWRQPRQLGRVWRWLAPR